MSLFKRDKLKKNLFAVLCLITVLSLGACGNHEGEAVVYDSPESMAGIKTGVFVGAVFDDMTLEMIPTAELEYYQSPAECIGALLEGKIDLTINEDGPALLSVRQNPDLTILPYKVGSYQYGAIFNRDEKGYAFCSDFNAFIKETWSAESLAYLYNSWLSNEDGKDIDYQSLPATNGTVTVATDSVYFPLTFIRNGNHTGFEIELIYRYCKAKGYALKFDVYDLGGVLAAVSTGKADIGLSSLIITEERKKSYYMSDPYATGSALFIVRKENAPGEYNYIRELDGKTIGVEHGTIYDVSAKTNIVDPSIEYIGSVPDIMVALRDGTIDAGIFSDIIYDEKIAEEYGLFSIGSLGSEEIAYALSKNERGQALKTELDEYILKIKAGGELEAYREKWLQSDGNRDVDYDGLEDINGTIRMAVSTDTGAPVCYRSGDKYLGFDIDIIVGFAREYGYDLEITDYSFRDLMSVMEEGTCDIGVSNITITENRKKRMLFSEPYYESQVTVVVRKQDGSSESRGFINTVKNKIGRTLIEENRYKLYLRGIATTCIISFSSAAAGLVLGYFLFLLFRRGLKIPNALLRAYEWVFNALPVTVILMIFYYVIFGNTKIGGIWVSVAAFMAIFSISVLSLLKTCFQAVDEGQFEAAYALGYSRREALYSVIIPQVLPVFLPPFVGEFMNLFKATAIVGYIAVQDITKISDIIRSRTYEAFFPLFITTFIYFVIAALFGLFIKYILRKFDPKARDLEKYLKGVREDD